VNGQSHVFPIHGNKTSREAGYDTYLGLAYQAHEVRRCINAGLIESPDCSHADTIAIAEIEDSMRLAVGHTRPEDNP